MATIVLLRERAHIDIFVDTTNLVRGNTMLVMARNALFTSIVATLALLTACGDDGAPMPVVDAGPDAPSGCTATDATVMFATNHSHGAHVLMVTKEDVQAGVEKSYSIQGAAAHDHTVVVTAADFMMLQMGSSVMITSSTGTESQNHTHVVTIGC